MTTNKSKHQSANREVDIPKTPARFIAYSARPHFWWGVGAFCASILAQMLVSVSPFILKQLVDAALAGADQAAQIERVTYWSMVFVGALGAQFLFWRISGFVGMEFITRSVSTAYETLYDYVSLHSHTYFSNRFAGSLSNKISNAAEGVDRLLTGMLWEYGMGFLSLIFGIALFVSVSPLFGVIYVGLIVIIASFDTIMVRRRRPMVVASAAASSRFRGVGVDMLTNMSAVRQFAQRELEAELIAESLADKRTKNVRQWRFSEWAKLKNNILVVIGLGVLVSYAISQFAAGEISVGDIVMIVTLVFQMNGTLVFMGSAMNQIVRVYGEMQEGLRDTLEPHEIMDAPDAQVLDVHKGTIAFDHVHFAYENQPVFRDLSLMVHPGERVGVVGGSGAGKTTLVSLLLRQHELRRGAILIDGQDIARVTQDSLRKAIAVVPQEPQLFHRSIRENIGYGKLGATDTEVKEAARLAYASEFIETLSEGYDTLVGERGVKLSGGQRQRIAIARAILKNAPILVLDEATSALDSASEVAIQRALHTLMEKKTVIAIAHRLSTLREMDRIIVLSEGAVAESGTHDSLLAQGGIYANLWKHQVDGFIQE